MKEISYYEGLLHAYSLGCLGKEEIDELKEYFGEYAEYPWGELGEFQNLSALLPSILNIETLSPKLKDKVARRLYRLREEARSKRLETEFPQPKAQTVELPPIENQAPPKNSFINQIVNPGVKPEVQQNPIVGEEATLLPDEFFEDELEAAPEVPSITAPPLEMQEPILLDEPVIMEESFKQEVIEESPVQEEKNEFEQLEAAINDDKPLQEEESKSSYDEYLYEEPKKRSLTGYIIGFVLFAIAAAGVVFLYLKMNDEYKTLQEDNTALRKSFDSLALTVKFNRELQDILEAPTTKIVVLKDLANNSAMGKVFISVEEQRSVLFLRDMPQIEDNQYFTLWMDNINLGSFRQNEKVQYHVINTPIDFKQLRQIILTVEDVEKAEKPSVNVYMRSEDPAK